MTEPMFVEGTLPSSGARFRMWVGGDGRWAVIEANGVVTYAPGNWQRLGGVPADLVADMAPALWEAGQP